MGTTLRVVDNKGISRGKPALSICHLSIKLLPIPPPSSAMLKARPVTDTTGQEYVVFTADQQLYRVVVHVMWENQVLFGNLYLRLGGMHLLMSYVGCIGSLMAGSGILEVLSEAFGGVLKMITGKRYPDNVRALRMLVEELISDHFSKHKTCYAWMIYSMR